MGSSQSNMTAEATPQQPLSPSTTKQQSDSKVIDTETNNIVPKKRSKKERTGYDLVQYKCRRRKARYDKCYAEWYNQKFLTGKEINTDETCDELFDLWKECVLKGMVKERERQGHGPPEKGSILAEYLEEQSEE